MCTSDNVYNIMKKIDVNKETNFNEAFICCLRSFVTSMILW